MSDAVIAAVVLAVSISTVLCFVYFSWRRSVNAGDTATGDDGGGDGGGDVSDNGDKGFWTSVAGNPRLNALSALVKISVVPAMFLTAIFAVLRSYGIIPEMKKW